MFLFAWVDLLSCLFVCLFVFLVLGRVGYLPWLCMLAVLCVMFLWFLLGVWDVCRVGVQVGWVRSSALLVELYVRSTY